jgi:hypothetical protein
MKFALSIAAALLMTSANAFACNQFEAQVIGKVTSVRVNRIDQGVRDCYFKAEFSQFNPHGLCPIDQMNAETNEILDPECRYNLSVGQEISGYLIEGLNNNQIILE